MAATPKPIRKEIKKRMGLQKTHMKENIKKGISSPGVLKVAKRDEKRSKDIHKANIKMGK